MVEQLYTRHLHAADLRPKVDTATKMQAAGKTA